MSVYGESNNSVISGVFVVKGKEAAPAFDVAPDWESYEFTPLDADKDADKEFTENAWAWDKPLEVSGKTYEFAVSCPFIHCCLSRLTCFRMERFSSR